MSSSCSAIFFLFLPQSLWWQCLQIEVRISRKKMQGLQDPETQSQGCWDMAWRSNRHILAGWPWSRWWCMDNWVPLADQWKTVGMVSSVLGSRTQGGRGGGRVCPDNSPSGTWVKSVLKQKQQRAGFQQAPSAANNTVESQELTVGPVARIHLEPPVGGAGELRRSG